MKDSLVNISKPLIVKIKDTLYYCDEKICFSKQVVNNGLNSDSSSSWTFGMSELISVLGIFVTIGLAIWISKVLQDRLNNERCLKNIFIDEVLVIKQDYRDFFNSVFCGKNNSKSIQQWFKVMSIKIDDIGSVINDRYGADQKTIKDYNSKLRILITGSDEYNDQYNNENLLLSERTKNKWLGKIYKSFNSTFVKYIEDINDSKTSKK